MGENELTVDFVAYTAKTWTRRDLTIVSGIGENCLVIACDSCGAIGVKDGDAFRLPPRYAGKFTARVALSEVMCSGAWPVAVTNGVACEMRPTGEETISGLREELSNAGISDIVLTGSTEENFATSMTALAITVIGVAREDELKFMRALQGDKLILIGRPCVGQDVDLESKGFYGEIRRFLLLPGVREIVPVGSKGVMYEAEALAYLNSMTLQTYKTGIDYFKSAGPATCMLVLCDGPSAAKIAHIDPSGAVIGEIR
jgi:hypothetical protein